MELMTTPAIVAGLGALLFGILAWFALYKIIGQLILLEQMLRETRGALMSVKNRVDSLAERFDGTSNEYRLGSAASNKGENSHLSKQEEHKHETRRPE